LNRSTRASAVVLVLGAAALLLSFASCQKVIGLPDEQPTYAGGAGAPKPVKASQACNDYCAAAMAQCGEGQDAPAVYSDENSCRKFCTKLEEDEYIVKMGTRTVDPIECRTRWVNDNENPIASCSAGSPTGGAECGNICELYCELYRDTCTDFCEDDPSVCTVPPEDDCVRQCESLRVDGKSATLKGGTYDQVANYNDDSLQCRVLHLVNAISGGTTHCGHSGFNSNSHCVDDPTAAPNCSEYCKVVEGACTADGDTAVYESLDQCAAVCDAMTDADLLGTNGDGAYTADGPPEDSPNTIGCRRTHSYFAFAAPENHCSHAGPLGAPACVEPCESFCVLKQQACPADPEQTDEQCMAECAKIEGANEAPDYTVAAGKDGGDFNCRVLHLVRALELDEDARGPECGIVAGTTRCPAE
jgi:hypothetical protein